MRTDVTEKEVRDIVKSGDAVCGYADDAYYISFHEDMTLTYTIMSELSELFGTRLVNVEYEAGCGDYSEYTPGDPAMFQLVIGKAKFGEG